MPKYYLSRVVTPASSRALVTLDQAKIALGVDPDDDTKDAAINQLIDQVSAAIDRHCDRVFVQQGYRDQFRAVCSWLQAGEPLRVRQAPLAVDVAGVPVVAITEDGAALDPADWEAQIETGELYRLGQGGFSQWSAALIVVDYDGGFEPVPGDVQGAALEWLSARWSASGRDPALRSFTIPDVISRTYNVADANMTDAGASMPALVRDWLARYQMKFV